MRILKIVCLLFCMLSIVSVIQGIRVIHSPAVGADSMNHGILGTILSVVDAVFWAVAFYGIHKKAPIAWKLGWVVIVVGLVQFLILALSSAMRLPKTADPWVASLAIIAGGCAVALYWSFWWKQQKSYFLPPQQRKT
jgi:hypothetical protein